MSHTRSIRRFLLTSVLALVGISLGLSGLIGYLEASHEMEELFDARLAQSSRITNQLLSRYLAQNGALPSGGTVYEDWEPIQHDGSHEETSFSLLGEDPEFTSLGHKFERNLNFQLFDEQGTLLLRSPNAPTQPLGALEPGFNTVIKDGYEWRTFTLHNPDKRTWLITTERDDERGELASTMATLTMLPLFITLPFLLGLLWWLIRRGLAPLQQLTQAIGERRPTNLSPLQPTLKAQELTPLIGEINRLMHTLADTLEREKQFTNEAAHELRTPLAVLRIHSENALAAEDDTSREQSLQKMLLALDRSDRLIRQLLTQARIDNQQAPDLTPLDLGQLLQSTLAALTPLALKKKQQISLEGAAHLPVMGQATLLELMFSNIIDNALRYTPVKGVITVVVRSEKDRERNRVRVDIRDTGPGIPNAAMARLCERFFRVNPQQGDGVGLGMAIVQRIAQLHGAELEIHNRPQGGLEVSVLLPAPPHDT